MKSKIILLLMITLSVSCSSDYSPKPRGYHHIELPEPVYNDFVENNSFMFSISNQTLVEELKDTPEGMKEKNGTGFNLNYPRLNAKIYCSYFRINKPDFPAFMEESNQMVYDREKRASGVKETEYNHPEQKVYGLIYEIQGDAISPIQFVVSDSARAFFRGALFFNTYYNKDSIAPVLAYINKDIQVLIESFQWKQ